MTFPPAALARAAILTLLLSPAAPATVLDVGPGHPYATPSKAASAARDGDTVRVHAGTYRGDVCVWRAHNLVLEGDGPEATVLDATGAPLAQGKAIWVITGTNTTVRGLRFQGAACPDRNGAGLRAEGRDLKSRALEQCVFVLGRAKNGSFLRVEPEDTLRRTEDCLFLGQSTETE